MSLVSALTESETISSTDGRRQPTPASASRLHLLGAALAVFAFSGLPRAGAVVVTDDFSDLNDTANPAWVHLDALIGSTGQTWDASTGQYHLNAPNNGFTIDELQGPIGFVGSYVASSFTDVKVTADFVQPATGAAFGVTARSDGVNEFNTLTGYGYVYEPFAADGLGEMVLYRIEGANLQDIGSQQVTLDLVNKDYTFSLEIIGNELHGQIFEIGGEMVGEKFATDDNYASGFSGIFGYCVTAAGVPTDITIDNFSSSTPGSLPGDFDDDNDVDADDLVIWNAEFGAVTNGADADGDGDTDGADFLVWQSQYTGSLPPATISAAAVPEPFAFTLALPAVFVLAGYARRRNVAGDRARC